MQTAVYNRRVRSGSRVYEFEVRRAKNGRLYLRLSELQRTHEGEIKRTVLVFEDAFLPIWQEFNQMIKSLQKMGWYPNEKGRG